MVYTVSIVPIDNYCSWHWLWILYGTSYANLVVGLCQAGTLTCLVIQLNCLFKYSNLLNDPEFQGSKRFEREMMHKLKSRQCIAIFVMLILIAAIIAVYIFHVLIWHKFINE